MPNKQEIYEGILEITSNLLNISCGEPPEVNELIDNTLIMQEYYKAQSIAIEKAEKELFNYIERLKNET